MNKRGNYGSMAERVARNGGDQAAPPAGGRPTLRHCWVTTGAGRLPGLLLEWRQRPDGWYGRVVHAVEDHQSWVVVEEWLPATLLDPTG